MLNTQEMDYRAAQAVISLTAWLTGRWDLLAVGDHPEADNERFVAEVGKWLAHNNLLDKANIADFTSPSNPKEWNLTEKGTGVRVQGYPIMCKPHLRDFPDWLTAALLDTPGSPNSAYYDQESRELTVWDTHQNKFKSIPSCVVLNRTGSLTIDSGDAFFDRFTQVR